MQYTVSSARREQLISEDLRRRQTISDTAKRASLPSPLPLKELPRFMRSTKSFRSLTLFEPPVSRVRAHQIKEVDMTNKPHYMRETEAYRKQVEKSPEPPRIRASRIKEVDTANKPRYMRETESYRRQVEKSPEPLPPRTPKPWDPTHPPAFTRSTRAWESYLQPAPLPEPPRPALKASQIREVDPLHLPHYMGLTRAARQHVHKEAEEAPAPAASPAASTTESATRSAVGSPRFMNVTASYQALLQRKAEERELRAAQAEEEKRQRQSLAVRREKWQQHRQAVECVAIKHKERIAAEITAERRLTLDGQLPRFMKDTAASRQHREETMKQLKKSCV